MNPSHSDVVYLGKDLDIDLWFRASLEKPVSVLIRTTNPNGQVRTSFMHVDGRVEQIPVFDNVDPLVIQEEKKHAVSKREFVWSPEREKRSLTPLILKLSSTSLILIFLAFALTGLIQLRVILTGSMKPAINPGDLVVAASTKLIEPKVGKVALYSARDLQGNAVTVWAHRITAGNTVDGFTFKGDANTQSDIGTIPLKDINSVIVLRIPFVGHIFNVYSMVLILGGFVVLSIAMSQRRRM